MSDFVVMHFPEHALELIFEMEKLNTVEQVIASLSGYESLILSTGAAGRKHIQELRAHLQGRN